MRLKTVTAFIGSEVFLVVFTLTIGLGAIVLIATFAMRTAPIAANAQRGLPTIRDENNGVTCYVLHYNSQESISCVRDLPDAGCAR